MFIQLCEDEGVNFPLAVLILLFEKFIDDILSGAHDLLTALQRCDQLIGLLDKAKLKAHKWSSNTLELLEGTSPNDQGFDWTAPLNEAYTIKVLGITWNPISDSFVYKISVGPLTKITENTVLSLISKLFDPMGWISPIIVAGKIFMQDLWRYNHTWDEPIPLDFVSVITDYVNSLNDISKITIPCWTGFSLKLVDVQLHEFSDASQKAYGAII